MTAEGLLLGGMVPLPFPSHLDVTHSCGKLTFFLAPAKEDVDEGLVTPTPAGVLLDFLAPAQEDLDDRARCRHDNPLDLGLSPTET